MSLGCCFACLSLQIHAFSSSQRNAARRVLSSAEEKAQLRRLCKMLRFEASCPEASTRKGFGGIPQNAVSKTKTVDGEDAFCQPRLVGRPLERVTESEAFLPSIAWLFSARAICSPPPHLISSDLSLFAGTSEPSISIGMYLEHLARGFQCSRACFVIAIVYIDRLVQRHRDFRLNSLNVHRIALTALLIAVKFQDDKFFANLYYANVGGVKTQELNSLEVRLLRLLDYRLHVQPEEFERYLLALTYSAPFREAAAAQALGRGGLYTVAGGRTPSVEISSPVSRRCASSERAEVLRHEKLPRLNQLQCSPVKAGAETYPQGREEASSPTGSESTTVCFSGTSPSQSPSSLERTTSRTSPLEGSFHVQDPNEAFQEAGSEGDGGSGRLQSEGSADEAYLWNRLIQQQLQERLEEKRFHLGEREMRLRMQHYLGGGSRQEGCLRGWSFAESVEGREDGRGSLCPSRNLAARSRPCAMWETQQQAL